MPRLTHIGSRLKPPAARVSSITANVDRQAFDARRDQQPWRRWYKTTRWQRLRWQVLQRDLFTCQWPGCGRVCPDTSELVADHRVPHRGDEGLFWAESNLQALCKACHDGPKARAEARGSM